MTITSRVSGTHWNLVLGLVNAAWSAIVALAVVPIILHYLGLGAYGLVGFFAALQAVLAVLDMGLSPTMSREVARADAAGDREPARTLLRTLALVYWGTAGVIALTVAGASGWIAQVWLRDSGLSDADVRTALILMGVIIALRWPVGLYTGAIMGAQRLALVSLINIGATTLSNAGAVAVIALVSPTIGAFFAWQAAAALATVLAFMMAAWRVLGRPRATGFDRDGLRRIWRFSAGLGLAGLLGAVFMQSDKIVLSRLVSLEALGAYTLAGLLARLLYIVLTPTFNLIYPRMTAYLEGGDRDGLWRYYRDGTRLLVAAIFPASAFVAVFAFDIVALWTGNEAVASNVAPLVPWMVLGTALNGVMHFPYALQLAAGHARLPALINAGLLIGFVPLLALLAWRYGVLGAAAAWAALNAAYLVVGTIVTHRAIPIGNGWSWLTRDVGYAAAATLAVGVGGSLLAHELIAHPVARLAAGGLSALATCACSCLIHPSLVSAARAFASGSAHNPLSIARKSADVA